MGENTRSSSNLITTRPIEATLTILSTLLIIFGTLGIIYYWFFYDSSVDLNDMSFAASSRVNNIGLIADRLVGSISCWGISLVGILISLRKKE